MGELGLEHGHRREHRGRGPRHVRVRHRHAVDIIDIIDIVDIIDLVDIIDMVDII